MLLGPVGGDAALSIMVKPNLKGWRYDIHRFGASTLLQSMSSVASTVPAHCR
jgi:hypothetical protein